MPQVEMRIKGHLDRSWSDWFDGLIIHYTSDGETLLKGPIPDQAALYGLVAKARDIGLQLLSIHLVENTSLVANNWASPQNELLRPDN